MSLYGLGTRYPNGQPRTWDADVQWTLSQVGTTTVPPVADVLAAGHLRLADPDAEAEVVAQYIGAAVGVFERFTGRPVMATDFRMSLDRWPSCGYVELPKPPVRSVGDITYIDGDGDEQILAGGSPATFQVFAPTGPTAGPARIAPLSGEFFPGIGSGYLEPIVIEFTAGYGSETSAADVPRDILQGLLQVIGEFYKQRSESVQGTGMSVTPAVLSAPKLWAAYRRYF